MRMYRLLSFMLAIFGALVCQPATGADEGGIEARREAVRAVAEEAIKKGDQAAATRHYIELVSLPNPLLCDCRWAIHCLGAGYLGPPGTPTSYGSGVLRSDSLVDASLTKQPVHRLESTTDWQSLAKVYEVAADVMDATIDAPPQSFIRPGPPAPPDFPPAVEVQVSLDGVWEKGGGTAESWLPGIKRSQQQMKQERFTLLYKLAGLYRDRLNEPKKVAAVLRRSLADVPFFTIPLEKLTADQWPMKERNYKPPLGKEDLRNMAQDMERAIHVPAARDLVVALVSLDDLDAAIDVQSRVVLGDYSTAHVPYRDIEKLWWLLQQRPKQLPLPRVACLDILGPERPSIEFNLDKFAGPKTWHKLLQLSLAARSGLEFDTLELAADMESSGGYIHVACEVTASPEDRQLFGGVTWYKDLRKGRELRTNKFKVPKGTGVIYFSAGGLPGPYPVPYPGMYPDGVYIHRLTVKATFRQATAPGGQSPFSAEALAVEGAALLAQAQAPLPPIQAQAEAAHEPQLRNPAVPTDKSSTATKEKESAQGKDKLPAENGGSVTFKLHAREGLVSIPDAGHDYYTKFLPLSNKPLKNLKVETKYHSKRPLYGELELGIGPDNKIAVVVDEAEGERPRIYVDRNRDRNLANGSSGEQFSNVRIDVPYPSGPVPYSISFFRWPDRPDFVAYRGTTCREGEIELDGQRYKIVIQDDNFAARFDDKEHVILIIDLNQDGVLEGYRGVTGDLTSAELYRLNEPFNVHGKVWEVASVSPDGMTITLRPSAAKVAVKPYLTPGNQAPDFSAPGLDGKSISLKQEAAKAKIVLLNFWLSSSNVSRTDFRDLRKLYAQYKGHGLQIIGVSQDRDRDAVREVVERFSLTYPQVFEGKSEDGSVKRLYRVLGYSQNFLLDKDLTIVARGRLHAAGLRGPELAARLRDLLGPGDEQAAAAVEKETTKAEMAGVKLFMHDPSLPNAYCNAKGFRVTILPRPSSWDALSIRGAALHLPYVYVLQRSGNLLIVKITRGPDGLQTAAAVGEMRAVGDGADLIAMGNTLLCSQSGAIAVYSLADPSHPKHVQTIQSDCRMLTTSLVRSNAHVFLLFPGRFSVFDVAQPSAPRFLTTLPFQPFLYSGCVVGGQLYVGSNKNNAQRGGDGISVYDVTKPQEPRAMGFVETDDLVFQLLPVDSKRLIATTTMTAVLYSLDDPLKPTPIGTPLRFAKPSGRTAATFSVGGRPFLVVNGTVYAIGPRELKKHGDFTWGGNADGFPYRAAVQDNCAAIPSGAFVALLTADLPGLAGQPAASAAETAKPAGEQPAPAATKETSPSSQPQPTTPSKPPPAAESAQPLAQQIIDRMAKAYTDCKSYRDSGAVRTLFVMANGNRTTERPFTTAFVRPDRFRFEYQENDGATQPRRYIIWCNGKDVQTWWDVRPGIEKPESLGLALAGATGVSGGSAHTIPSLLLPGNLGASLAVITDAKRTEDGKLEKVECFRVKGNYGRQPITIWIDKKSYLVRQIDEQRTFDTFRTEQTTTYDPTINEKIADEMLKFDPPAAQGKSSNKTASTDQKAPVDTPAAESAQPLAQQPLAPADQAALVAARKVLEDAAATYKALETYTTEGTVIADMDTGATKINMTTTFSIALKKPNRYLISWTQKNAMMPSMIQSGTVWSDGTQPYLYMGTLHAYSKMSSDEIAVAGATGVSGGAAMTIPSLFLPVLEKYALFSRLKDPKLEKTERVGDEDCYVVSGTSAISTKETFWISKSKHFIMKDSRSLTPPEGGWKMPKMTGKQLDEAVRGMGLEVTEENKKKVREQMAQSTKLVKAMKISGTFTELYLKVSAPALKTDDFQFVPPKDAVLKDSLFAGLLGRVSALASANKTRPQAPAKMPPPAPEPPPIPLHGAAIDVHGAPLAGATVLPLSRDSAVIYVVINGVARYLSQTALSALETRESGHGTPVFNGAVKKDNTRTSTDAKGQFLLEDCPDGSFQPGQSTPLRIVTADGHTYDVNAVVAEETIVHVPTLLNVEVKKVENVAVGELAGVVIDENGKPLEGVDVHVGEWHPGYGTQTDRNGIFRLNGFDRDDKVEVRFRKPGYSPETFIELPTGVSGWVLVLGKRTFFEGVVRGPGGQPVPHALVRADQGPRHTLGAGCMFESIWTETTADDAGHFRLYVQPDRYQFSVTAPGIGVARLPYQPIGYGQIVPLDVKLQPGVTFRAKVVDAQTNKPVQGVRLWSWQHKQFEGRSDADGVVTIAELLPGDFDLQVEAKGYTRWWSEAAKSPWNRKSTEDSPYSRTPKLHWQRNFDNLDFVLQPEMKPVEIVVEKGVRIRGRVVDPDGKPVVGATVAPALTGMGNSLTGDTRFSVTTTEGGTFDMLLPASNDAQYNLMVHDGKFHQWRTWANGVLPPIQTRPGEEVNNVELTLTRPVVVRGKVVDHQGNPAPYCDVRAHAADKFENRYYDPTTTTKPDGTFELKFLRAGEQFVQAAPFWLRAEDAPPGSTRRITVELGQTIADVQLTSEKSK